MLYATAYGVLYFYKEVLADPRDAVSLHASKAGLGLIGIRVLGKEIVIMYSLSEVTNYGCVGTVYHVTFLFR